LKTTDKEQTGAIAILVYKTNEEANKALIKVSNLFQTMKFEIKDEKGGYFRVAKIG
jgi:hypothetical protein